MKLIDQHTFTTSESEEQLNAYLTMTTEQLLTDDRDAELPPRGIIEFQRDGDAVRVRVWQTDEYDAERFDATAAEAGAEHEATA